VHPGGAEMLKHGPTPETAAGQSVPMPTTPTEDAGDTLGGIEISIDERRTGG
jgi:hypothetical protein